MEKQIIVRDESGKEIDKTFSRRAKQLVNSSRAVWLDEAHTSIRMMPSCSKEDINSDKEALIEDFQQNSDSSAVPCKTGVKGGEETLLRITAKRRADSKRFILYHTVIYIAGYFISNTLYHSKLINTTFAKGFCVGFMIAWGILLLLHIASYFLPYIRISPHLNILGKLMGSDYSPVEDEYKKLKNMDADRLADEFKRL